VSLAEREDLRRFLVYAKPIVVSTVLYQAMALINRHLALDWYGAEATGKLSLATDLGFRVFLAISVLPETLLFQHALRREAEEGRAAAQAQIGVNMALVFAVLAPLAVGYAVMQPTFEALLVPHAFRGDFARLSLWLTPGFFAFCALYAAFNPVFQLEKTTWPLTLAALAAIACDIALLALTPLNASVDGLAQAHAISLCVGLLAAAIPALRRKAMRPRWRDLAIVAAATTAMGFAIAPLNGIAPAPVVAALAVVLGGGPVLALFFALDVGGLKTWARARWAAKNACAAPAP
jgi:O-antigen/teichoic acid export membrane protein